MSAYRQLRDLLLGEEQRELQRQQAQIAALRATQDNLASQLPALIETAQSGPQKAALQRALSPAVAAALDDSVRRAPQSIVDALFPIIGPAIRKAIAEALRSFVVDLNRAMEMSFTPRGLKWRIESWRTGVPFAQVVMRRTLNYSIDHLFLIEQDGGILLYRYSAPELADLDADAIAGMLTAIGDFVRDSVQSDHRDSLGSATIGEHVLIVKEGPRANLAAFVRGVPPQALLDRLAQKLEDLHRAHGAASSAGAPFDWQIEAARQLDVTAALSASAETARSPLPRWPFFVLFLLLAAGVAALAWSTLREQEDRRRIEALVGLEPGWQMLSLRRDDGWRLRLLRDPDSRSTSDLEQRTGAEVKVEESPFLSLDDVSVATRAKRALALPEDVHLAVVDGTMTLSGRVENAWAERYLPLAATLAGVRRVVNELQIELSDFEKLMQLKRQLERGGLSFPRGGVEVDANTRAKLSADVAELLRLAAKLDIALTATVAGRSDEGGSVARNLRLRAERAKILHDLLVESGMSADRILYNADDPRPAAPFANMRWEIQ